MSGHRIKLLREVKEDVKEDKLAPQEKIIYEALLAKGLNKEIDRDSFVEELEKSGKLTTRQEVSRVVSYYLQHMTKIGVAESIKPEPVAKEEKPKTEKKAAPAGDDKPAKPQSPSAPGAAPKPTQAQA
jgi:DNA-directed RNA polymerase beta' subunit